MVFQVQLLASGSSVLFCAGLSLCLLDPCLHHEDKSGLIHWRDVRNMEET